MSKKGSGRVVRQFPREHVCDSCSEYSTHMNHRGLVYQFHHDENGACHRHIVSCPHPANKVPDVEVIEDGLPLFDGFPYLITRVVEAMRHIIVLPADRDESSLRRLAELQVQANRLDTCLVLGAERAIFYTADGKVDSGGSAPRGGVFVTGKLQPAEDFEETPELMARGRQLEEFEEANRSTGYMACGPHTSRRKATPEELVSLAGVGRNGIPRGLAACRDCGEYRGQVLGTDKAEGWVATVYCPCENHNRCARCGGRLAQWRLNGHVFEKGQALHVPGFCGLSHVCPPGAGSIQ